MRPKPDGSERLIADKTHPHNAEAKLGGEANASIKDDMLVEMTYIKRWTGVLHWVH